MWRSIPHPKNWQPNFAEYDYRIEEISEYPKIRFAKMAMYAEGDKLYEYIVIVDNEESDTIISQSNDFIQWVTNWIIIENNMSTNNKDRILRAINNYIAVYEINKMNDYTQDYLAVIGKMTPNELLALNPMLNYCVSILINGCKDSTKCRAALIEWDLLRDTRTE